MTSPIGTAFTRDEARRALRILDRAIDTAEGFDLARRSGAVAAIFGALVILEDYVSNSNPIPLERGEREPQTNGPAARPAEERAGAGARRPRFDFPV